MVMESPNRSVISLMNGFNSSPKKNYFPYMHDIKLQGKTFDHDAAEKLAENLLGYYYINLRTALMDSTSRVNK